MVSAPCLHVLFVWAGVWGEEKFHEALHWPRFKLPTVSMLTRKAFFSVTGRLQQTGSPPSRPGMVCRHPLHICCSPLERRQGLLGQFRPESLKERGRLLNGRQSPQNISLAIIISTANLSN